jgi:hypothetical protein
MIIWMEFGVGELPSGFCNWTLVTFGKFLGIMVNIYSWVVAFIKVMHITMCL